MKRGSPGAGKPHAGKYGESTPSRQRGGGGWNNPWPLLYPLLRLRWTIRSRPQPSLLSENRSVNDKLIGAEKNNSQPQMAQRTQIRSCTGYRSECSNWRIVFKPNACGTGPARVCAADEITAYGSRLSFPTTLAPRHWLANFEEAQTKCSRRNSQSSELGTGKTGKTSGSPAPHRLYLRHRCDRAVVDFRSCDRLG